MAVSYGPKLHLAINALTGDAWDADLRALLRAQDQLPFLTVKSRTLTAPPGSPANGDAYILAAAPTGLWAGHATHVAVWTTDNPLAPTGEWEFYVPNTGWLAYSVADSALYVWNPSAWSVLINPAIIVSSVAGRTGAVVLAESDVTGLVADLAARELLSHKDTANGYPSLDSGGHIPLSELPAAIVGALQYQGVWDASTNTPTLANGTGTKGFFYKVSVAGNTSLDGYTGWHVGDLLIFDGMVWDKVDNYEAVTSVAGRTGAVVIAEADVTGLVADLALKAATTYVDSQDAAEATARAGADTTETAARIAADALKASITYVDAQDAAEVTARGTAVTAEATARASADTAETASRIAADALAEILTHKDVASGYAGLDPDAQIVSGELPSWFIEGINNAVIRGPVDGSGNPNYIAVSTVSTVATAKFVCAAVPLELYIGGYYQKVADDNVVNVVLANGVDATHAAANFVYLKRNTGVKQLTAADIGATIQAPIFGNNQTQPAVSATATKKFWFNPMLNKWMSSVSGGAYVADPIVPIAVIVVDNTGVMLGIGYWGPRLTPWKVMELFGQGADTSRHNQTGSVQLTTGGKSYNSLIVSGGILQGGAVASVHPPLFVLSQAPVVICGGGTFNDDARGAIGGAAINNGIANGGVTGSQGGGGAGGGGSTARAGGAGGGHDSVNLLASAGVAGTTAPTAGGPGSPAFAAGRTPLFFTGVKGLHGGGGGGGGSDNTNAGGAGGNGGGELRMFAPALVIAAGCSMSCNGGAGGNSAGGNSSGGGGGGGGYCGVYACYFAIAGTFSATGGAAGTGTGTGTNGGAGGAGIADQVKCF